MLNNASGLNELREPPGNRLEALRENRQRQFSILVNDQWRICLRWRKRVSAIRLRAR
jgi:proteic killer suppression protein